VSELFNKAKLQWKDIDLVIPHQASKIGLELFQKMFQIPQEKWVVNIDSVGNLLSASIPMALQEVITSGRLKRGQTILIIGTGAGFSMGGLIIKY
jgi:3-oxoacyl-[acyl-carrier-protein] synthase-3